MLRPSLNLIELTGSRWQQKY